MKKFWIALLIIGLFFSCASAPEGFEDSKAAAATAKDRADAVGAPEDVPNRYGEAVSVYELAQAKEAESSFEESMDLYQKAEVNFNVAAAEAEKKQRVDSYMTEVTPLVDELDKRISQ